MSGQLLTSIAIQCVKKFHMIYFIFTNEQILFERMVYKFSIFKYAYIAFTYNNNNL